MFRLHTHSTSLRWPLTHSITVVLKQAQRPLLFPNATLVSTLGSSPPKRRYYSHKTMGAPVILCGKTEMIGTAVVAALKPEFDVIHFVLTPDAGAAQIPAIFRGEQSPPSDSQLGSKDYSEKPVAVFLGGAYTDADAEVMMKAAEGIHPVPWLRPDMSKPTPPLGPEYGKAMVERIKGLMSELEKDGKMKEEKVFWY